MYSGRYGRSFALVIGINVYQHANPLITAVSDAQAVARVLVEKLGFTEENVALLCDESASRGNILKAFHSYTQDGTEPDDRLFIFFAGHGHTVSSLRSPVGYLVPTDGRTDDLGSLIRWDELTRNADLIAAKHIFFVMDACYGGLAVNRSAKPGSVRFIRDMVARVSRQVLTSGKSDEPVSDGGGPLPHHSVFTGHFLEALSGKAKDHGGNLTANGINAYVYQCVGRDTSAGQTPHYGHLHGEGDFIFEPFYLDTEDAADENAEEERLVDVPALFQQDDVEGDMKDIETIKELLSDDRHKIQLRDFMVRATRHLLATTSNDSFPVQGVVDREIVARRFNEYEEATQQVRGYLTLLGYWGQPIHVSAATLPFVRVCERLGMQAGSMHLINLRWYPAMLLLYSFGIGAVASENYGALSAVFQLSVLDQQLGTPSTLIECVTHPLTDSYDLFKFAPDMENKRMPRSQHIYRVLQPQIDDLLFLGRDYDFYFDRFEVMYCLQYAYLHESTMGTWGPLGRFGWKLMSHTDPMKTLRDEADVEGQKWKPLQDGLFGGNMNSFIKIYDEIRTLVGQRGYYV